MFSDVTLRLTNEEFARGERWHPFRFKGIANRVLWLNSSTCRDGKWEVTSTPVSFSSDVQGMVALPRRVVLVSFPIPSTSYWSVSSLHQCILHHPLGDGQSSPSVALLE